jgi:hypothetical protein
VLNAYSPYRAGNRQLFLEIQERKSSKGLREMIRSWKHSPAQDTAPASRLDKHEVAMKADFVGHAQALVKIEKVDAATEQDVLAVIDCLRTSYLIGGRAATQKRACFEHANRMTGSAERGRSRQAGQTTADDDHVGHESDWKNAGYRAGTRDRCPPPPPLMISMASQITIAINSTSLGSRTMI